MTDLFVYFCGNILYMDTNQIRLRLQNFRAIQDADIILDGITVVAGENGCGKSTISKFLYYTFRLSNEYDKLVTSQLLKGLRRYYYFLDNFQDEISKEINRIRPINVYEYREIDELILNYKHRLYSINRRHNKDESAWIDYIGDLQSFIKRYFTNKDKLRFDRLERILKDVLVEKENIEDLGFQSLLELLKDRISEQFEQARVLKEIKPSNLLIEELGRMLSVDKMPEKYEISEYNSVIISDSENSFIKAHSVQQVAYVDTPMLVGLDGTDIEYWDDLNAILHNDPKEELSDKNINEVISKEILHGETFKEEVNLHAGVTDKFVYKREDGSEFNLLDCATGVKSFAILQMMLKSGFLNKYTLLIIDEPESHLHPQWIIEYARLLVLLNKHIGVKFFIASHNPDMVSAIKYISEKEEIDDNLNFYIAISEKSHHSYKYIHLGTDIEPIFESFNIALDRINLYGTKNG